MNDRERTYKTDMLTRVEGEGRFHLRVEDGKVVDAGLSIFEAPRYFEAFLRGRSLHEVPDIVARICGICPVAYQMSSVRALEGALGLDPGEEIRSLRRLLYCAEWIESHALHVFLLHAPDFLGYPSAVEMAADHREVVECGLALKKTGNSLIEILGGRAVHPISVRVGGFTKTPTTEELLRVRPFLSTGLQEAVETVRWAATLPMPEFEQDYVFVALESEEYPLEWGDEVRISGRGTYPVQEFEEVFQEDQVEHSNALHCRLKDGTPYMTGPMARLNLCHEKLHPIAASALEEVRLELPVKNPYRSIVVRAIEIVHAFAEALDLIDRYRRPPEPYVTGEPRDSAGFGATEAPRGLLYHRYGIGGDGLVKDARIVPPTSQNQARIEADLVSIAPRLIELDHDEATLRCEQLIRAYDPCISCATHFLRLDVDRGGGGSGR
jgi:coenzyme F420-reducing hydrogenase alpha subunit